MLTLFTTAKPFRGHIAVIQRNALQSWKLLDPDVEIILFGDDLGSPEVCAEFGLRHIPLVGKTAEGAILLDDMFAKAQHLARHHILCYANCDIIFQDDFSLALRQIRAAHSEFLVVGRRWDTDVTEPINFVAGWQQEMRRRALAAHHQRDAWWIDYFAFSRGLYGPDIPPFAIGRVSWDDWLVWKIIDSKKPVIDASAAILAIHQNHDYTHHAQGHQGVWESEEAKRNFMLSGGWDHLRTIADATEVLTLRGLKPNRYRHWLTAMRRLALARDLLLYKVWNPIWFSLLDFTRPLRSFFGLRSASARRARAKE